MFTGEAGACVGSILGTCVFVCVKLGVTFVSAGVAGAVTGVSFNGAVCRGITAVLAGGS